MRTSRRVFLGGVIAALADSKELLASTQGDAWVEDQTRPAIRRVLDGQAAAWNAGDVDGFLEGYWNSPALTFSGSGGTSHGWRAVRERYRLRYPDKASMGELAFSSLEIRPLGPAAALVLGHWHLNRAAGDIGGVFTLVFQHIEAGWRIVHDHTSLEGPARNC